MLINDFPTAEPILTIPQKLLLTAALAFSPRYCLQRIFSELQEAGEDPLPDERAILVLLLLVERARGGNSAWAIYISTLPEIYGQLNLHCNHYTTAP